MAKLFYVTVSESRHGSLSYTRHITPDHHKAICGVSVADAPASISEVTIDNLDTAGEICPRCREAAPMRLRPRARYWYLDPWAGSTTHEFPSLKKAKEAAAKEHCAGSVCIWQLGPGRTNRIAAFVEGLPPLP
jgi:hypothetical protein